MRTALRLAVCVVMAATAQRAFARNPASNGCGDGEANVPFATLAEEKAIAAEEIGGGSGEPGGMAVVRVILPSPASNGCGDGEANVPFANLMEERAIGAEEIGGGSGEPGVAAEPAAAAERAEAAREFERHVWTDP